jgi:hypothetical protein
MAVGDRRIDLAIVAEDHIVGVEIKGPKDSLARIEEQLAVYRRNLPEVWVFADVKWRNKITAAVPVVYTTEDGEISSWPHVSGTYSPRRDYVTVPLLRLLWRDELLEIAVRHNLLLRKSKARQRELIGLLARKLTGDEIVREACLEIRCRGEGAIGPAFGRASDPPLIHPRKAAQAAPIGELPL